MLGREERWWQGEEKALISRWFCTQQSPPRHGVNFYQHSQNVNINFNIFYNIHGYRAITILFAHLLMCDVVDETPREFVKSKSSTFNFFPLFPFQRHTFIMSGWNLFFFPLPEHTYYFIVCSCESVCVIDVVVRSIFYIIIRKFSLVT
jgi:hypothetical protein